ncbi:MAG: hypothetical protein IT319_16410 [Anaerolineae bacterium]|nr:hypothetical protein [Anaerolineae bacterium]
MTARYAIHVPKVTEMFLDGEDERKALERGRYYRNENEYDVVTVFRIEDDVKTPTAFFWNGQKFIPQTSE